MQCSNCVSHVSWNLKLPFHVLNVISEFLVSSKMKWYKDISKAIIFSCVEERESYRKGGDKRGGSDKIRERKCRYLLSMGSRAGRNLYICVKKPDFFNIVSGTAGNRHDCQVSMFCKYPCRNIIWATLNLYLNIFKHFWASLLCQIRKPIAVILGRSGLKHCQLKCHSHGEWRWNKQLVQSPLVSAL